VRMGKETIVCFKALTLHLPEENHKNTPLGQAVHGQD
jgi:hypothetical protein